MKRIIKILIIISAVCAIFGLSATILIYNYIEKIGEERTVCTEEIAEADCIIVLGAGVRGNTPSMALKYRLDKAFELYQNSKIQKIIVSGDHSKENYDEVNVMRDYLAKCGIPLENIFMDHAGFSTYESLYRARDIFGIKRALIVTQELHLSRALYIAKSLGLECQGVAAENSTAASTLKQNIREYPARAKAFLQCEIFRPKPTYLGEAIPISGSGIVTEG